MELSNVIKNLRGMKVTEDIEADINCAFEDYEFEGESEIMVSESSVGYQAYANHKNAPILMIQIEGDKIVNVWEL